MKPPKELVTSGFDTMGIVLAVWLCTLPFVGLLFTPVLGISTTIVLAIVLLVLMLALCWGRCMMFIGRALLDSRHQHSVERVSSAFSAGIGQRQGKE